MLFAPKHILVPVAVDPDADFHLAEHAVFAACDIAEKFTSKITLLHLAHVPTPGGNAGVDPSGRIYQSFMHVLKTRIARGHSRLAQLEEQVKDRGIAVEARVIDSVEDTVHGILHAAEDLQIDLMVIGSHGRHGLSKVFFGSVAESIAKKTVIPVLLLHPPSEPGEQDD